MEKRYWAIIFVVLAEGLCMGLTAPMAPAVMRDIAGVDDLGWRFGAYFSLHALMQLLCLPLLGAASDRFGRRPVLLLSVSGAAADFLLTATAPELWLAFAGRMVAGATAITMPMAIASIADTTSPDERTKWFGRIGGCLAAGFILGPSLGGLLGGISPRAPYLAAALLTGLNVAFILRFLPESLTPERRQPIAGYNPLAPIRWALAFPTLLPLLGAFMIVSLVSQLSTTLWVLYGETEFGWDAKVIGASLTVFGLMMALSQAFVAGPLAERLGKPMTVLVGMVCEGTAFVAIAFTGGGWAAFALIPLLALGSIGMPALQAMLSERVHEEQQGRLQGVLACFTSLAAIAGPLAISSAYYATRPSLPGLIWLAGALIYCIYAPLFVRATRGQRTAEGRGS